jgi:arylsulfatase A-like enzyme
MLASDRIPGVALAAAAVALAACGADRPDRPNVVLITLDTTRSDHLSAYGYERPTSPVLERLAAEGALFELAYAPSATTGPSHATMFTSRYPASHRVLKNGVPLSDDALTLAEVLGARGYQTGAVVSSWVLKRRFGYAQGFEEYEQGFDPARASITTTPSEPGRAPRALDRRADATTDRALEWLEERRDPERPFLLFVHYFDPHEPYDPPPEPRRRFARPHRGKADRLIDLYDAEIAFTDQQLGRLLDALRRLELEEDTLVIVAGDHGEGLGEHGHTLHGINIYEEAVRVPLVLRLPGRIEAGLRVSGPVELVDLLPTVLELLDLPPGGAEQGRSLAGLLREGEAPDEQRPVFLERRHYKPQVLMGHEVAGVKLGLRHGRWKLIVGEEEGTRELYDLAADPDESRNLYEEQPETVARLTQMLETWRALVARESGGAAEFSEADRRQLEALGYTE